MQQSLIEFSKKLQIPLSEEQIEKLLSYARLVWGKKDFLNLTSVENLKEIITRHICDGLVAVPVIKEIFDATDNKDEFSVADFGSGAGYIGLTVGICLPSVRITLVESLEKRCSFLNWVIVSLKLSNVKVKNVRLGQANLPSFDVATERAMGQLNDILSVCVASLKKEGTFIAYQTDGAIVSQETLNKLNANIKSVNKYLLPYNDKLRNLVVINKCIN